MKKFVISVFFLISSVSLAQLVGPKISVPESSFDFGEITDGENVTHDFVVFNTGDDVLKIINVRASCGCTAAKPEKDQIAPGESATVNVQFNSSGRQGSQRKYVYVTTNDPNNSELRLIFTTMVLPKVAEKTEVSTPRLMLEKNQHDFGDIDEGKIVELNLKFKNVGKKTLEISEVKTSCGCTAALLSSKKIEPGNEGNIKIELDTTKRSGKLSRTVAIHSNDPLEPVQVITLYVNIITRES